MVQSRAAGAGWINHVPIAVMSAGWLSPLLLFWLAVWGPLRPYGHASGSLGPSGLVFLLMVVASIAASRVSARYFSLRSFERSGRLYEALGVRMFRRVVPDGDLSNRLRRRKEQSFRIIHNRQQALAFVERTKASERSHLVLFIAGVVSVGYAAFIGWNGWGALLGVGNVLVNGYPVILQRYTRARIAGGVQARITAV
ncbi:MAG TPA: hypothetical protein VEX86_08185 [Longimicrobium sp.]|nr:hypothetical protein [Longimicrobium sp.]